MTDRLHVRPYRPGEEAQVWAVYHGSTRRVVARDYTPEQVARWAPDDVDLAAWAARLAESRPFVAVLGSTVVGFAELEPDGHVDRFYCHPDHQREGIGSALLERVEAEARARGLESLFAEVSVTAHPFFTARGFETVETTENVVCGTPARQHRMRKAL